MYVLSLKERITTKEMAETYRSKGINRATRRKILAKLLRPDKVREISKPEMVYSKIVRKKITFVEKVKKWFQTWF